MRTRIKWLGRGPCSQNRGETITRGDGDGTKNSRKKDGDGLACGRFRLSRGRDRRRAMLQEGGVSMGRVCRGKGGLCTFVAKDRITYGGSSLLETSGYSHGKGSGRKRFVGRPMTHLLDNLNRRRRAVGREDAEEMDGGCWGRSRGLDTFT